MQPLVVSAVKPFHAGALRYAVPVAITAGALLLALAQVDFAAIKRTAGHLRVSDMAIIVGALGLGALLASLRLRMIARDIGYPISLRDAIAALSLGQIAGSLFFQIVGQTIARGAFLSRRGMPLAGTLVMTGYERLAALVVSLGLAVAGAWYLFGRITLDIEAGGAEFVKLAVGGVTTFAAGAAFAWGKDAARWARLAIGPGAIGQIARNLALSVAIQLSTMTAYVAAARAFGPEIGFGDIAAAAAVVMLAAALPISLAGWGVRELSAIYALGVIGLPKEAALVVAIVVGLAALVVVAALALGSLPFRAERPSSAPVRAAPRETIDYGAMLAWSLPILAGMAVLFQVHAPLASGRLNVNLADPIAIIGAVLFIAGHVKGRRLPSWRLPGLNAHLAVMTVLLVAAFVHGWIEFGWTAWAFTNRTMGWFVLLAHMATGALIVNRGGASGLMLLLQTYAAAALAIVVLDALIFAAIVTGFQVPVEIIKYRIEGFSQNPNALALQLLFAIAAMMVAFPPSRNQLLMIAIGLVGLWLSGSRSGLIALATVCLAALAARAISPRRLLTAGILATVFVLVLHWLPEIVVAAVQTARTAVALVASLFPGGGGGAGVPRFVLNTPDFSALEVVTSGYQSSNVQRIASLHGGWEMFAGHPIIGAGLGAFIESYTRANGTPLVIHSTPLWVLAELGLVGFVAFAAPFVRTLKNETYQAGFRDPARAFLIMALLGFGVMALVHDLLFQRALWLLAGAALAVIPCASGGFRVSLSGHDEPHIFRPGSQEVRN